MQSMISGQSLALDFETYYDAECSVKSLGLTAYINHPRFKVTHAAVYSDDYTYSGPPQGEIWDKFDGAIVIAHNASFDRACFEYLQSKGVIDSSIHPKRWVCTAAMSRYLNGPGSLADCGKAWLGEEVDKTIRDKMCGGQVDMFNESEVRAYALNDARLCWELNKLLGSAWPEEERRLWEITVEMGQHGVEVDERYIREGCKTLARIVREQSSKLPWVEAGKPALSLASFGKWCETLDIKPPLSTSRTDERLEAWKDAHADSPAIGWLNAMQATRRANRTMKVLQAMLARRKDDGRMAFELLYCGASTGRWSGAGGLNMQNFNRGRPAGIDLRSAIVAPKGKQFVVIDYSQIESRVLLWLAGDHTTLDVLRTGVDIYEAHARASMGYNKDLPLKDADPKLRHLAKARVLGLGYGCGAAKFVVVAKIMGGLDLTFQEAQRTVQSYRSTNKKIVDLWYRLEDSLWERDGAMYRMQLPSGRFLRYYNVNKQNETAESIKGQPEPFYGGKLCENLVSATARDVLADAWLKLHREGLRPVMSVHDELVFECDDCDSDAVFKRASDIMRLGPAWASDLPLDVEGQVVGRYTK